MNMITVIIVRATVQGGGAANHTWQNYDRAGFAKTFHNKRKYMTIKVKHNYCNSMSGN